MMTVPACSSKEPTKDLETGKWPALTTFDEVCIPGTDVTPLI